MAIITVVGQPGRLYTQFASKFGRPIARFTEMLLKVGQLQLLRRQIANQLSMSCKFDSKFMAAALETLNESLMADIQAHYHDPQKPCPDDDNELLSHLSEYLEHAGMHDPISKVSWWFFRKGCLSNAMSSRKPAITSYDFCTVGA